MDFARRRHEVQALQHAGLSGEEDLCAPLLAKAWASRVIGLFERTIDHLVALAVLLPIVASVGGSFFLGLAHAFLT